MLQFPKSSSSLSLVAPFGYNRRPSSTSSSQPVVAIPSAGVRKVRKIAQMSTTVPAALVPAAASRAASSASAQGFSHLLSTSASSAGVQGFSHLLNTSAPSASAQGFSHLLNTSAPSTRRAAPSARRAASSARRAASSASVQGFSHLLKADNRTTTATNTTQRSDRIIAAMNAERVATARRVQKSVRIAAPASGAGVQGFAHLLR